MVGSLPGTGGGGGGWRLGQGGAAGQGSREWPGDAGFAWRGVAEVGSVVAMALGMGGGWR